MWRREYKQENAISEVERGWPNNSLFPDAAADCGWLVTNDSSFINQIQHNWPITQACTDITLRLVKPGGSWQQHFLNVPVGEQ